MHPRSPCRRSTPRAAAGVVALCAFLGGVAGPAGAQTALDTTVSRRTLDEAAQAGCDGVSVVVQRCTTVPGNAGARADDALTRSRAATKAAFDRRDRRARDAALEDASAPLDTPIGGAQQLGAVTVTGKASEPPPSIEDVLQRALNPGGDVSKNGIVTHYGLNGDRTECIAKCVGPMCCTTMHSMPNPARESNSIGR